MLGLTKGGMNEGVGPQMRPPSGVDREQAGLGARVGSPYELRAPDYIRLVYGNSLILASSMSGAYRPGKSSLGDVRSCQVASALLDCACPRSGYPGPRNEGSKRRVDEAVKERSVEPSTHAACRAPPTGREGSSEASLRTVLDRDSQRLGTAVQGPSSESTCAWW
jgi:hypothetical protein